MGKGKVQELFAKVDGLFTDTLKGGVDDEMPWKAVHALRLRGSHLVFSRAATWCSSPQPLKRARAAAILAQLRLYGRSRSYLTTPSWMFRAESFDLIARMLTEETDIYAIGSEITALGHLDTVAAVETIAPYARHSNENVRYAVAFALGCYPNDPISIDVLQDLMEDTDRDVRDWAIFGLGVLGDADSEELRVKFLQHLDDSFLDARIEAAAALGKRRDARLAKPLVRMLKADGALYGIVEAVKGLLGLSEVPPDWLEDEYIAAISREFPDPY